MNPLLLGFLTFLNLSKENKTQNILKTNILTEHKSKESYTEKALTPEDKEKFYKIEPQESKKTIIETQIVGNEILTKEITITESYKENSIQTKTTEEIVSKSFVKGI